METIRNAGSVTGKGTQTATPLLPVLPRQCPSLPASKEQLTSSTVKVRRLDPDSWKLPSMAEFKKPTVSFLAEQWSLLKAEELTQVKTAAENVNDEKPVTITPDSASTQKTDDDPVAENDNDAAEENSKAPEPEELDGEQAAEEDKPIIKLETAPADFRFPTTNQTRHCFTRYIEYHRCIAAKGDDTSECNKFAKYYRALCPGEWIDRWNEQRENGTFPGPL